MYHTTVQLYSNVFLPQESNFYFSNHSHISHVVLDTMNDPKHVEEVTRKKQGWNRTLAITHTRYSNPRHGRTQGYDINWRREVQLCVKFNFSSLVMF